MEKINKVAKIKFIPKGNIKIKIYNDYWEIIIVGRIK